MKTIPLQNGGALLVDDEDFDLLNQHKWYIYDCRGRRYLRAYIPKERGYIYITNLLFKQIQHSAMIIKFKDGNNLNWQRENILMFTTNNGVPYQVFRRINVPNCPLGPAHLERADGGRSPECADCDDSYKGPYYHCLDQVRKTFWRGWRRIADDNDGV